jgi:SAM-dependent methyltransferase
VSENPLISSISESSQPFLEDIRRWFGSTVGQHVLATESAMLEQLLPGFFGYHLAQLSVQDEELYASSNVQQKYKVHLDNHEGNGLVAAPSSLPFANDSIDVVLLHHLLDYVESPHEVLREVSRVTLPMGHVVIVGFNPMSLWGVWQSVARYRGKAPWHGSYIRPGRLMDWLNLLNFKIDRAQYAIYKPLLPKHLGKVRDFSQGVSRSLNLPVGSVYVIVARKHVGAIRPIRPVWKRSPAFGGLSVVNSVKHDDLKKIDDKGLTPE